MIDVASVGRSHQRQTKSDGKHRLDGCTAVLFILIAKGMVKAAEKANTAVRATASGQATANHGPDEAESCMAAHFDDSIGALLR